MWILDLKASNEPSCGQKSQMCDDFKQFEVLIVLSILFCSNGNIMLNQCQETLILINVCIMYKKGANV